MRVICDIVCICAICCRDGIDDPSDIQLYLGDHDQNEDEGMEQVFKVAEIIMVCFVSNNGLFCI